MANTKRSSSVSGLSFRRTVVEPERLFAGVAIKVERLDRNIGSLQRPLKQAPEVLQSVRVDLTANVPFQVVDCLVNEILFRKVVIALSLIGVDRGLLFDVIQDLVLQCLAVYVWDNLRPYLASLTVSQTLAIALVVVP
jgi:hypothetical protein